MVEDMIVGGKVGTLVQVARGMNEGSRHGTGSEGVTCLLYTSDAADE